MDHQRVAEMLTLWGIWSRAAQVGPRARLRCGSIESDYVAGHLFDDDREPPEPRVSDDLGLRIERAVVAAGRLFALAMTLTYVERVPVQVIGERLGVRDPGAVIDQAHADIARRLR